MNIKKTVLNQAAICIVMVLAALASLGVSDYLSSPEFHAESLASLDEKKVTVMELTAASAAASVAISAVPGDATTPIANQVSELSSYLLLVTGVILLEKILLTLTGYLAFKLLIPIACALVIVSLSLLPGLPVAAGAEAGGFRAGPLAADPRKPAGQQSGGGHLCGAADGGTGGPGGR